MDADIATCNHLSFDFLVQIQSTHLVSERRMRTCPCHRHGGLVLVSSTLVLSHRGSFAARLIRSLILPLAPRSDAADLFQQAGNRYKIEQRWRESGVAFEKEAGARMQAGEANDAISECREDGGPVCTLQLRVQVWESPLKAVAWWKRGGEWATPNAAMISNAG